MKKMLILLVALMVVSLIYYQSKNKKVIKKRIIIINDFGIVTQEDIYTDTIDLSLYTSHGRLKDIK